MKLRTYAGESGKVLGTVNIMVNYEQQKQELSALIVEGSGPNLIGRDWLKLDCKKLFKIHADRKKNQDEEMEFKLEKLMNQYSELFKDA